MDTQVLTSDGELLGHLPVDGLFSGAPFDYAGMLQRAIDPQRKADRNEE